jgi:SAM-dependent methyltransferase
MIALDHPLVLQASDTRIVLRGWCSDETLPQSVAILIAGIELPASIRPAPAVDAVFPALKAVAYTCPIDFAALFRAPQARYSKHVFAVTVWIQCGKEERGFEYAVPQEWVNRVFAGADLVPHAKPPTPAHLMVRVSGSSDMSLYPTGHLATRQMRGLLAGVGRRIEDFQSILDFGCGCGRVLLALHNEGVPARLHGSDVDQEGISWCAQSLGSVATFGANEGLPPTRYEAATFDLVYAISVFTHLPEAYQFAWLAELRRIIKPGGWLIATIHGPATCRHLPAELQESVAQAGFLYVDQTREDWPKYLGAKTEGLPDFYRLAYHTFDYVRRRWSEYFDVLNIVEQGLNFMQDAVVCQKTIHPRSSCLCKL